MFDVQDARLQTLLLDYQNAVLKAQKEVEANLSAFLNGRKQIVLLRQSVTAANNALTIAMDQYTLGTRDFTTVLTAEQNLAMVSDSRDSPSRVPRTCSGVPRKVSASVENDCANLVVLIESILFVSSVKSELGNAVIQTADRLL